ncbi:hypothetical protein B0O99DRAFT_606937 [Bisporella sp. PMI_857]|nr:hypothetical protein B0O99DRAFT_606937 [Bisporella sp. PMI_857]
MTDWNKFKVIDLKAELKARGLSQAGLKPALVARLTEAENGDGSESEATVQGDSLKIVSASAAASPDTISPTQPEDVRAIPPTVSSQAISEVQPTQIDAKTSHSHSPDPPSVPIFTDAMNVTNEDPTAVNNEAQFSGSPVVIEVADTLAQTNAHGSALPSVEPQEAIEDRLKRKRRSESPPVSTQDVARKRIRQDEKDESSMPLIGLEQQSIEVTDGHAGVSQDEVDDKMAPTQKRDDSINKSLVDESPSRPRDSRFKDLFAAPQAPAMEKSGSRDSGPDLQDHEPERAISPAIHPATAALYIRDFMRPLNPATLKNHLASLATPPGHDTDPDIVDQFYIDSIRTHAFVSFANISAASRVRSALHSIVWPDERNRKPLWVDFIPIEKVANWIDEEDAAKERGRGATKWEVAYDIDEDRNVTPYLQPQDSTRPQIARQPSISTTNNLSLALKGHGQVPTAPRGFAQESELAPKPVTNTNSLDQLFNFTEAKPKLYWKPVSKELADKRLDHFEDITSKSYDSLEPPGSEVNRYTFEDDITLVDRGLEVFPGLRPPIGFRGPTFGVRGLGPGPGPGPRSSGYEGRRGGGPRRGAYMDSYRGNGGHRSQGRRDARHDDRY